MPETSAVTVAPVRDCRPRGREPILSINEPRGGGSWAGKGLLAWVWYHAWVL